jgi:anti-anti-sigma factor
MEAPANSEVSVIRLQGNVRMGDVVDSLRMSVDHNLKEGHSKLVLDMSRVLSLDSSGIGVIVRSLSLAKRQGGVIKLSAVPPAVMQTLQVTGVYRLFEFFDDESTAVASF